MKLPPVNDEAVRKSATVIPMLTSEWQSKQDPDNAELQGDDDRFRWDGRFVANPKVLGSWTTVALAPTIDEFAPDKPINANRAPFREMTIKDKGRTDKALWIWSGDVLMDLDRYQALKMTLKKIDGSDYLFIEAGGFSTRNPAGWQPPWQVMKRQTK